jgi:hypothetical protein
LDSCGYFLGRRFDGLLLGAKDVDHDGLGRAREIADKILQHLRKLDLNVRHRCGMRFRTEPVISSMLRSRLLVRRTEKSPAFGSVRKNPSWVPVRRENAATSGVVLNMLSIFASSAWVSSKLLSGGVI